jgi:glucose-6-phosphate 1-epimerase
MGWRDNLPWGVEVKLPSPVPAALQELNALEGAHGCLGAGDGSGACRNWAQWSAAGLTTVDGRPLSALQTRWPGLNARTQAALLMPAGPSGPAWLVTPNYQAIWRYNRADAYALAIGLLSDALRGDPPQSVPWPTDDPGISRAEVRELQTLLRAAGHCNVTADGSEGPLTNAAIRAEEARRGWPESGRAGARVLQALRAEAQRAAAAQPVVAAESPMSAASAASPVESPASAAATPEVAASSPEAAASAVAAEPAASAAPGDAAGAAVVAQPAASAAAAQAGAVAGAEPATSAVAAAPVASAASTSKPAEGCPAPAASVGRQ